MMSSSWDYTSLGRRHVFDVLKLLERRGLTSYALTHIKQTPKEMFRRHLFFFFPWLVAWRARPRRLLFFFPQIWLNWNTIFSLIMKCWICTQGDTVLTDTDRRGEGIGSVNHCDSWSFLSMLTIISCSVCLAHQRAEQTLVFTESQGAWASPQHANFRAASPFVLQLCPQPFPVTTFHPAG